jgi:hypothetical protein
MKLIRFAYTEMGTFGRLYMPGFSCVTVERPWRLNQPFVSCIPPGVDGSEGAEYPLKPSRFRGKYDTVEVCGVPGRTVIKIHIANYAHEVQGCIGIGDRLGGEWGVLNSTRTFRRWWEAYQAHGGTSLIIDNDFAGGM